MGVFDPHIQKVGQFVESMKQRGCPWREFDCSESSSGPCDPLPIRVGPAASSGIIMRGDTFVELGNPTAGSCAALLWSDEPAQIQDGRVRLLGPDIPDSRGRSLPFGQILMLAGEKLLPADHERLQQTPIIGDQIEGYMLRSAAENIWSRVSKDVAARGFDFEMLGQALLRLIKGTTKGITHMEIVFVTSSKEDVRELSEITLETRSLGSEILKESWKARGYDLECTLDCASCHDEEVCDDIREVLVTVRKKARDARGRRGEPKP